ncbi:MAG: hypothetical protein ACTTH7_02145 [Treponema sp.]
MRSVFNFKAVFTVVFFPIILTAIMGCASSPATDDPDFLGDFPPQNLGTLHLNIVKRFSNDLAPRNVSFIFEPTTNLIRFHHKFMGDNIWIYLDKDDRCALKKAIETYLTDFKTQQLTSEGAKKKGSFGTTRSAMSWGIFGSAHSTLITVRFEYRFITPQRPYFIIASDTESSEDGYSSPAICLAVSPAQCKDFLTVVSDDMLIELVNTLRSEHEKFDSDEESNPIEDIEKSSEEVNSPAVLPPETVQSPESAQPFDEF